ncbi:iron complex outermembrane recepter protein [Mariniphaga anaerophila]|uniref:Iron complex outermembrane recepter protein n=1 Tax=Mariniphaga anaerophila TaxID=1484053 RepID=A0A1M5FRN7_9BACT|nr:TonB-dependent receptor [Mariniphaga anaerophila]SHF94173.1 iron complex outermembrane recepter protein [Mariniphaga anaerophila]
MKKPGIYLIAISFLIQLFIPVAGMAQASFNIADTIKIEEVVVTGTPVKVNRNSVPMAVSVIDRAQIEETDESALLPVLNGKVPGLFVTERGITGFGVATGSAGQISIRGVGGSPTTGVLMLIDGHPQFMGIMGHPLPDSYVASDAERVEVIRGPASILYGSNAMGGVINIITKKQENDGLHGNARLSYGSFNTQKYMGSLGYKKDKFSVFVSGNHDNTNGHRDNSDFKINNGYVKLGWDINSHFNLSTDFSLAAFEAADPGPDTLKASPGERIDITRGYWSSTFLNDFGKASGALKVFYNFGEHNITDGFHSKDHNYGLNFYESLQLFKGNNVTLGVDYMNYGGIAENLLAMNGNGIVFADTSVVETGVYGFVQQSLFENFILNAGLRYQNHSVYGDQWIPAAGFAWQFFGSATWKGNVSKGFRSPTIRELFLWGPNPKLSPESIISYETGFSNSFFERKLNAEITFFSVKGDNLIITVPMEGLRNAGEINNKGIEFLVNIQPVNNLKLEATYSYVNMEEPVYATPEHHLYFSANYKWKKLQFMGSVQHIGNLDSDASSVVSNENYTLLKAKAVYNITRNLKLYLSGENLTNEKYAVNRYYTMPGTTVFSGLNIVF